MPVASVRTGPVMLKVPVGYGVHPAREAHPAGPFKARAGHVSPAGLEDERVARDDDDGAVVDSRHADDELAGVDRDEPVVEEQFG